jgi:hypothetical protein
MTISAKDLLRYLDGMTFPVDVLAPKDDRVMVWATGDQLLGLMAANGVDGIGSKGRVNRSARVLANGLPVVPDYREMGPATGQQKGCMVLSDKERAKGFVRPVRQVYTHVHGCGTDTRMGLAIAETYARDPGFYSGTFCCHCAVAFTGR